MERENLKLIEIDKTKLVSYYNEYIRKNFPESECSTPKTLRRLIDEFGYRGFKLKDGNKVVGISFLRPLKHFYFMDFLLVPPNLRRGGYGSALLKKISEFVLDEDKKCGIILEIEMPMPAHKTMIEKRYNFYVNNNFTPLDVRAMVFGVEFLLMFQTLKPCEYNPIVEYKESQMAVYTEGKENLKIFAMGDFII